jgi:predicted outer membrane repeat protein
MRIRGVFTIHLMLILLLLAVTVCEGALYSITVSPVNSSSVPCGYNTLSPCHTLTNAFLTIPTLSNNKSDSVLISIESGVYNTCSVSYVSLVGNTTAATTISIIANGTVTLVCSAASTSIINQDLPGSTYFIAGLNFLVGANSLKALYVASVNASTSSLEVFGCSFNATGSFTFSAGVSFNTAIGKVNISSCSFSSLFYGVIGLQSPTMATVLTYVNNCSFSRIQAASLYYNANTGTWLVTNSSSIAPSTRHVDLTGSGTFTLRNCTFSGSQNMIAFYSKQMNYVFDGCTFSNIGSFKLQYATAMSILNSVIQNSIFSNSPLFDLYYNIIPPQIVYFTNIVFSNITGSVFSSVYYGFPKIAQFTKCTFMISSSMSILDFSGTAQKSGSTPPQSQMSFINCIFNGINSLAGTSLVSLSSVDRQSSLAFSNCTFKNFVTNGVSGELFKFSSYWNVALSNCLFQNISSNFPLFNLIMPVPVVFDFCSFQSMTISIATIVAANSTIVFKQSSFSNISGSNALFFLASSQLGQIIIQDSTISSVSSTQGGIIILSSQSSFSLRNSAVYDSRSVPLIYALSSSSINVHTTLWTQGNDSSGGFLRTTTNCTLNIGNSSFDGALFMTLNPLISIGSQSKFSIMNSTFLSIYSGSSGAALFIDTGCVGNLTTSTFLQGFSSLNGGAIAVQTAATLFISQSRFIGNFANGKGGAISFQGNSWSFFQVVFSNNSALQGGALYVDSVGLLFSRNVTFSSNVALNRSALSCSATEGSGGAMFVQALKTSSLTFLVNFSFDGNFAGSFGGAMGFYSIIHDSPTTLSQFLASAQFSSNRALSHGPSIGSPYQSLMIQSESKVVYSGSPLFVQYTFFDGFNQTVGSLAMCSVKIEVIQSTPPDVFQPFPMYHSVVQSGIPYTSMQDFSFFRVLNTIPMPNTTIELSLHAQVESYVSNVLNFSVLACPPGNIIVSSIDSFYRCIPCLAGTFQSYSNGEFVTCEQCPSGTFSPKAATSCSPCPVGTEVDRVGAGEGNCFPCSPGRFSGVSGGTQCLSCSEGTFSESYNQSSCDSCPAKSITPNNASYSSSQCVCPVGKFGQPWADVACEDCYPVRDVVQCDLNSSLPFVFPGFWRESDIRGIYYKCVPSVACTLTGEGNRTMCEQGYEGFRCGNCIKETHFHFDNYCKKCGDPTLTVPPIIFLLIVLCWLVFSRIWKRNNLNTLDVSPIILALQFLALYPRLSNNWPPMIAWMMNGLSLMVRWNLTQNRINPFPTELQSGCCVLIMLCAP